VHATDACAAIFAPQGKFLLPGELLRQPDYAATLARIAEVGAQDFYTGDIAKAIIADFAANDGLVTAEDLAGYRPDVEAPMASSYRGIGLLTVPLPASGPQLIQMLKVLERLDLGDLYRSDRAEYVHLVSRVIISAFADRARHLGDPRFTDVPLERLCSDEHADTIAALVCGTEQINVPGLAYRESPTTTNVCVLDSGGNAVALTHTLGSASGVVVPGLGFGFNNCMYQFNPLPGNPNSIAPGKARLTGITPSVLTKDRRAWAAIGGLGGTRILTAVLHSILNLIDHRMSPIEAVDAPRFHAESPWLELEARLFHAHGKALTAKGWRLRPSPRGYDRAFAIAQIALHEEGVFRGGSDPRGGGGIAIA
jgi:gamma-glutamyltranspeptidase/glutathione hydrolase